MAAPPAHLTPMKAMSGDLPVPDEGWAYEIKWDGMRIVSHVTASRDVRLESSRGADATIRFPELTEAPADDSAGLPGAVVGGLDLILDGEVVAFTDAGPTGAAPGRASMARTDFGQLQHRMHVSSPAEARRRAAQVPVVYIAFDLLWLGDRSTMELTYVERRRLLDQVIDPTARVQVPGYQAGDGHAVLEAARQWSAEGLMAKRLDSVYRPGQRSPAWRKIKIRCQQEVVVGGWSTGEGNRSGTLGALLVGVQTDAGFAYAGKVGTGFSGADLDRIGKELAKRARSTSPFVTPVPRPVARQAHWVEPTFVVQVAFAHWTSDGVLRHPAYLGDRPDKDPAEVIRET